MSAETVHDGPPPEASPTDRKAPTMLEFLMSDKARQAIMPMLPPGQTYDRIVREFLNAVADNPGIATCVPASIIRAISRAVSWDLEIGVTAFLIPRKAKKTDAAAKLTASQGYRGKIELMVRHRAARLVDAECVYANEHFRYEQGTSPFIEHRPIMDPAKRGELIGAYAYAKITAYEVKIVVMSHEEIDAIRQEYSQQWKTKWEGGAQVPMSLEEIPWYCLGRCVHRLSKQMPMSGKLSAILAEDEAMVEDEGPVQRPREIGEGAFHPFVTEQRDAVPATEARR